MKFFYKTILVASVVTITSNVQAQDGHETGKSTKHDRYANDLEVLYKDLSSPKALDFDQFTKDSPNIENPGLSMGTTQLVDLINNEHLLLKSEFSKLIDETIEVKTGSFKKNGKITSKRWQKNCLINSKEITNATIIEVEESYSLTGTTGEKTDVKNTYFIIYEQQDLAGIIIGSSMKVGNVGLTFKQRNISRNTERKVEVGSFIIAPNPASNQITVSFQDQSGNSGFIEIFDGGNKLVKKVNTTGSQSVTVDVSDLANGSYHLRHSNDQSAQSTQFVILK